MIRVFGLIIANWMFLSTVLLANPTISDSSSLPPLQIYHELMQLSFDEDQIFEVENVTLVKDRARFHLKTGVIYLARAIAEKVTGAVFLGDGTFKLQPPNAVEKGQINRFLEKDSLNENFSAAYFRFTDESYLRAVLGSRLTKEKVPKDVSDLHHKISGFLLEERGYNLASRVLFDYLNASDDGFFLAALEYHQVPINFPGYFMFIFEPHSDEEVSAYQFFPNRAKKPFHILTSFNKISDYAEGDQRFGISEEDKDYFAVGHYAMSVKLDKSGQIQSEVALSYSPKVDGLKFLYFDLYKELQIDSVNTASGDAVRYIKEKKEAGLSVILNQVADQGQKDTLVVYYSGKALEPVDGNLLLKDKLNWFPRAGYLIPATYELNFTYPKNWQVVAIGTRSSYREEGDTAYAQWVEKVSSVGAAFAYGSLDSTVYKEAVSVPVRIFATRSYRKSIRERIGGDVANSFYVLQRFLGGYPYSHLNVVETPGLTSNGYPGLLFLTWLTFANESAGLHVAHVGHEVSHEWWGNLIGWKTYHDQWLSEGLAEYSGALVAQYLEDGDKDFFQILDGWKTDLLYGGHIGVSLGLRRFGFSKADLVKSQGLKAGPIWIGHRLGTEYPIDYFLITYEKAAYMLHMLRVMLRDFDSGSDERFWHMLRDFVETYQGRQASTADFMRIAEKHFGENMDWFFDQWLYSMKVPSFVYSYDISGASGEFWVDLTVQQQDVPAAFKTYIPVGFEFGKAAWKTQVIEMQGAEKTFRLGPFETEPLKVIFNDYGGVLAKVKGG